jgi:DNA/RNA endonuclease G (NUC1)/PKD repeat protein
LLQDMKTIFPKSLTRKLLLLLLGVSTLFSAVQQAAAIIDPTLQTQLGNPTGATTDPNNHSHYLIQRSVESIDYSDTNGCPNWASWDLTASDIGTVDRSDAWAVDTSLPAGFRNIGTGTYGTVNGTSYDRGHMCPSQDRTDTLSDNVALFLMSNIIVQDSKNNEGLWGTFEGYCRGLTSTQELLITCGPYNFGSTFAGASHVYIPSNIFKIVVCAPLGSGTAFSRITNANPASIRVIAIETPNNDSVSGHTWQNYITSAKQVQLDTGYNFFSALPSNLAWVLRSKVDGQAPVAPGSISFSPPSGFVGTSITITGANLDSATNVTLNGMSASYTINSPTQITAFVPTSATSGPITVRTLGGVVTSSGSFTVSSPVGPDLALTKTHIGNFNQGDTGDTYTIIVTNVGNTASSGTITVSDVLPTGLTATAISGTGWAADLSTLTCTRSDALNVGAAYSPITVTVSVSSNASASVINTATVSGGGESNPANDGASDPTTINAAMLFVSPSSEFDSSGVAGGPFSPSSQIYTLTNSGGVALNWTASNTANWNTLSTTSGTLAPSAATTVTVSINGNANSLAEGNYSDTISFTNVTNGAGTTASTVNLTVISADPELTVTPGAGLTFIGPNGGPFDPESQSYTLSNSGGATLNWTAGNTANWNTLSATSGTLAPGSNTSVSVSMNANANSLSASNYSDTISFVNANNDAGDTTRSIALTVTNVFPSIVANGSTLASEGCTPTNGVIDPGELVTVNFSVKNIGSGNTVNLVATLLETNGVTSAGDPQAYGVVTAGGGVGTQPFTFTAGGTCGGNITATLQLQDGAVDLGIVTYTLSLGRLNPLAENFDGVTAPTLPAGWSTSTSGGQSNWITSTTLADSLTNAAFSPDTGVIGVNELDTPTISITTTSAVLTFRQFYSLAADPTNSSVGRDGGVLEIKIGGGSYTDILVAGGSFVSGGYNTTLINTNGNPLGGRPAWSGSSTNFITTAVNLPAAAAGQNAQLRWRGGAGTVPNPVTTSGTLAFWNFDSSTPNANTVVANVTAAPVSLSNAGASLTFFQGNPTTGEAVGSSGFTTSAGPPTGSYSYFAFALTVANGYQASLSSLRFDDRASPTGPQSFDVQISQQSNFSTVIYDSGAQSAHQAFTSTPMNSLALTNSGLTGTIYFRIYGYAAGGSAGTWRLDNLNVQGSVATGGGVGAGWYIDSVSIQELACCAGSVIIPPVASFTALPVTGTEPLTVTFSDASSGTTPLSLAWNLGDSTTTNTADGASFAHTYAAGTYSVTLTASNAAGTSTLVSNNLITVLTAFQAWQNQYFGCTNCAQAQPDVDPLGKGISNTNQFLAGLNPTNPASLFRIISVVPQGSNVVITWKAAGAHTNAVQVMGGGPAGAYGTNFTDLSGSIILQGSGDVTTNYVDSGGATNVPSRFYRIRLVQ